jgi:hypothetical protein
MARYTRSNRRRTRRSKSRRSRSRRSRYHRKNYSRKQYGSGNTGFSGPQLKELRELLASDGMTPQGINDYIYKIDQLSPFLGNFDDFYGTAQQYLEGLYEESFKEWIDSEYKERFGSS